MKLPLTLAAITLLAPLAAPALPAASALTAAPATPTAEPRLNGHEDLATQRNEKALLRILSSVTAKAQELSK
jgi:hypothetical protein